MDMYAFQELEVADNPAVIFRGIVGSHAYGTANAASDTDVRGVFVVPSREYVRLTPPPKQVSDARNDRTYYSLLRFCELMSEANPTTMEMLYLPTDCVLRTTPAFGLLVKNGEPIVRFEGEKLETLLSIRRGEWTFDEIMAHAEKIQAEIESGKGRLPVESDKAKIDGLIAEVMNEAGVK